MSNSEVPFPPPPPSLSTVSPRLPPSTESILAAKNFSISTSKTEALSRPARSVNMSQNQTDRSQPDRLSSLLSSPNFTAPSYINSALQPEKNEEETQRRLAELALQLQIQTQKCHDEIGRIGAELQAILPRCTADVSRLSVGLEGMKEDSLALRNENDLERQSDSAEALVTLSTLHSLKLNLTFTKSILSATSLWDVTINSIPTLLSKQKLNEAVSALTELERGERALRGMPGRQERIESIQKYRNQILSMLKPQLLHALQKMDSRINLLQQCFGMYRQLGKVEEMQDEYVKFRPGEVHKGWFAFGYGGDKDEFVEWLVGWFANVLDLLQEERRKAGVVFGKDTASEITTMVLAECFRPLLSSFKTRLSSLCPTSSIQSTDTEQSQAFQGSLTAICSAYQSTLQFLSLCYDNLVPDGSTPSNQRKIHTIFTDITSPFAPYQINYANLEFLHTSMFHHKIVKSIQLATLSTKSVELSHLQETLEKLQLYSRTIFPLISGALERYTILNTGFNPKQALDAMDKLLENHVMELTIAINRLSASATSEGLVEKFDEEMVQSVLEVLKMAGEFKVELKKLEESTKNQFKGLCGRIVSWFEVDFLLIEDEPVQELSLSNVEDMISREVLCKEGKIETAIVDLQQEIFFKSSLEVFDSFAHSCHTFVFDVCSSIPMLSLQGVSSLELWKEKDESDENEEFDSSATKYSTLPQHYITQVGEHMLALVQALEPFASNSEALWLANEVMGGIKMSVSLRYWMEFMTGINVDVEIDELTELVENGKEIEQLLNHDETRPEDEDEYDTPSAMFCNEWLDVVSTATTGKLLERIVRIPLMTKKGWQHLGADLNYLNNVLMALGVNGHPHPILAYLIYLTNVDEEHLSMLIRKSEDRENVGKVVKALEKRIAAMRGIYAVH